MKVQASKVTIQAVPVTERLNRVRKWVNSLFGFIKIGKRKPISQITYGHDRYKRMKQIASAFSLSGIFYGTVFILMGFYYRALLPENQSPDQPGFEIT